MPDDWLGIKEAASYAGVHRHTIYRWVKEGKLKPHFTSGGSMRFRRSDLVKSEKPESVS
jgi:excisionase family DNA binding protein